MKLRIPHGDLDQPLDEKSLWQLPQALDDDEERRIARECLCEARERGARTVGEALKAIEALDGDQRKGLINALRRKLGLEPQLPPARGGSGWSAWQLCPVCGCQPLDPMTGTPRPVSVRRWYCEAHVDQASAVDMEPMGSGIRMSESGALVEVSAGEIERARIEDELREKRNRERLAARKVEAEELRRREEALREEARRLLPPGFGA